MLQECDESYVFNNTVALMINPSYIQEPTWVNSQMYISKKPPCLQSILEYALSNIKRLNSQLPIWILTFKRGKILNTSSALKTVNWAGCGGL